MNLLGVLHSLGSKTKRADQAWRSKVAKNSILTLWAIQPPKSLTSARTYKSDFWRRILGSHAAKDSCAIDVSCVDSLGVGDHSKALGARTPATDRAVSKARGHVVLTNMRHGWSLATC